MHLKHMAKVSRFIKLEIKYMKSKVSNYVFSLIGETSAENMITSSGNKNMFRFRAN